MIKNEDVPLNDWITTPFESQLYYMDFPYIGEIKKDINKKVMLNKENNATTTFGDNYTVEYTTNTADMYTFTTEDVKDWNCNTTQDYE